MNIIRLLLTCIALLLAPAHAAHADDAQPEIKIEKRQLLVPRKGETVIPTAFMENPVEWLREKQRSLYGSMSSSLRQMRGESRSTAAWTLMILSFGYGTFHAAGPGHGKTVISAWLLATENDLKRGVLISFLSSIVQALSAIVIVSAILYIVGGAIQATRAAAGALETASFAAIGAMGLYLIWTAFQATAKTQPSHQHEHHDHSRNHSHDHDHDHAHCGHAHVPEAKDLRGEDWSLTKAAAMSFAIGLRPCTGAILVLLAAYPLGLYGAAIASVFAMAAGTFITVTLIAAIAVYARQFATRLAGTSSVAAKWLNFSLRFGGGLLVTVLGGSLFWASLGAGMIPG
jgi:nickel/cobalt transporter (NicO) family protein